MKHVSKSGSYCSLVLLGVLCNFNLAKQAEKVEFYKETSVVSCLPGEGPGQYYHWRGAGYNLRPRCFAIDPNAGVFYIPEVDTYDNIRLHKFDRNGKFVTMLKPEGKAYWVSDIVVSSRGDIYLHLCAPGVAEATCIYRDNREGKLLNRFGPQGPITAEDLEAEKRAKKLDRENPIQGKYFSGGPSHIFLLPNDEILIVRGYHCKTPPETFRFAKNGQLLERVEKNENLPLEVAQKRTSHLKRVEALRKAEREQRMVTGRTHSLIGPDGHFYYMSVRPEKLEIRKVTFYE